MGNVFSDRVATPPPTVNERPRRCPGDERVVDLICINDHIAATESSRLSNSDTEIATITVVNPNPITTFICEFTSFSTRALDCYRSIIDHNVSCDDMPSLKTDLACFEHTMLQEWNTRRSELRFLNKLKSVSDACFTVLVILMYIYLWFNFSGVEGCNAVVMWLAFGGIGYLVSEYLGRRVGILRSKENAVFVIWLCTRSILVEIDFVVTTGCQDLDRTKERQQDIRGKKKNVFKQWKKLSDLEDGRVKLEF